jgi:hypothetical protein
MKLTCFRMKYTQMHAIGHRSRAPRGAIGSLAVLLTVVLLRGVSGAQDTSRCGHSTVGDAWGSEEASQARSFLARLQDAVKANDKAQFASLVHYPVRVLGRNHRVEDLIGIRACAEVFLGRNARCQTRHLDTIRRLPVCQRTGRDDRERASLASEGTQWRHESRHNKLGRSQSLVPEPVRLCDEQPHKPTVGGAYVVFCCRRHREGLG